MKIKWGMMMTDGRGKLGGQVASKNRAGAYVRTKVTPINPKTSYQSEVRQNLAVVSKNWDLLTEKLRGSWNAAANSGEWNRTDVFGDSKRPTGKNLFTSINLVSTRVLGVGILDVPQKASFATTSIGGLVAEVPASLPGNLSLGIGIQVTSTFVTGTMFEVQATPPVSAGRSYFENNYRFISANTQVQAGINNIILDIPYSEKYGQASESMVGKKVAVRFRQVLNGQVSPWQSVVSIITAE